MNELGEKKYIILELMGHPDYRPMKFKELASLLSLPKARREELDEVLNELLEEGEITILSNGRYAKSEEISVTGRFMANAKGFGFVRIEGREDDIYISEEDILNAMDGDEVRVVIDYPKGKQSAQGHIIGIVKRANTRIVGMFKGGKGFGFVLPDSPKINRDIYVSEENASGAKNRQKVVVEILDFGDERRKPEGRIVQILGFTSEVGVDILSIAMSYGLEEEFSSEVLKEAGEMQSKVTEEEKKGRTDLTNLLTVTIDGEDAKDLDDAITLERKEEFWELGVHIADVTHYVREGSALDQNAKERGTSVYLVDRVLPMLPKELSNGICSLNAGEERLVLSCIMQIDDSGNVIGHRIEESLIHVNYRMSYTDVYAILEGEGEAAENLRKKYADALELFRSMAEVSGLIRSKRHKRGAVDFDFPESKVILDDAGKVVQIQAYERNTATKIIEDFMLCANETVAEEYFWLEVPFVYRVHDQPDPDKMKQLAIFIHNFGFTIKTKSGEVHPKELQKLLEKIEGSEAQTVISNIMLRSMKQARYQKECIGHFGLAAKYYTHFTSPIRRYPDLQIHRIIKENLHGKLDENRQRHYSQILDNVAAHSSFTERRAEEAERESVKYKKCEYVQAYIGESFSGIISGVSRNGFYVTLPNSVEGFVHVSNLTGDYYQYIEHEYRLVGDMFKKSYNLGQKVDIVVAEVNCLAKTIDFDLDHTKEREDERGH